jgi:hypothetical protein
MLYPSEATRKPLDGILTPVEPNMRRSPILSSGVSLVSLVCHAREGYGYPGALTGRGPCLRPDLNLQIQEIPDSLGCIVCKRSDVPRTALFPSLIFSASGFEIR